MRFLLFVTLIGFTSQILCNTIPSLSSPLRTLEIGSEKLVATLPDDGVRIDIEHSIWNLNRIDIVRSTSRKFYIILLSSKRTFHKDPIQKKIDLAENIEKIFRKDSQLNEHLYTEKIDFEGMDGYDWPTNSIIFNFQIKSRNGIYRFFKELKSLGIISGIEIDNLIDKQLIFESRNISVQNYLKENLKKTRKWLGISFLSAVGIISAAALIDTSHRDPDDMELLPFAGGGAFMIAALSYPLIRKHDHLAEIIGSGIQAPELLPSDLQNSYLLDTKIE